MTEPEKLYRLDATDSNDPIATLVRSILCQAIERDASQISIEGDTHKIVITYLIAGEWEEASAIPINLLPKLAIHLKAIAKIGPTTGTAPQEGTIEAKWGHTKYDFHVKVGAEPNKDKFLLIVEKSQIQKTDKL